jgi:hypothetical protein
MSLSAGEGLKESKPIFNLAKEQKYLAKKARGEKAQNESYAREKICRE